MKIIIASDHNGYTLKEGLKAHIEKLGHEPVDLGCDSPDVPVDYPDVAIGLAERIARGDYERGILICGTGIGMSIVANKVPGVYAACCHDPYSAERARKSNDAQVLTMGAQIVALPLACVIVDHWLASEFSGGRSTPKVEKVKAVDERYRKLT